MKINERYGMDNRVINLVKNELQINSAQSSRDIFKKASEMLPDVDFDIVSISDLIYHLSEA